MRLRPGSGAQRQILIDGPSGQGWHLYPN